MILLAVPRMKDYDVIMKELWDVGVRLGERPPNVDMKKDIKGGISIITARKLTRISKQEIIAIMNQYGMHNATITIKEDITPEQLIDVLEKNRVYINKVVVINKVDLNGGKVPSGYPPGSIGICAERGLGLEGVREKIYEGLRFMKLSITSWSTIQVKPPLNVWLPSTQVRLPLATGFESIDSKRFPGPIAGFIPP